MKILCNQCNHYFTNLEMIKNEDGRSDCLPCWFAKNRYDGRLVSPIYSNYQTLVNLIGKGPKYGEPAMAASVRSAEYNRFLQYDSANSQRIELWHILITQRLVRQHPEMMSPSIPPSSSSNQGMPIPTQPSTPFSGHRVTKTQTQAFSSYEGAYSGILCPACLRENKRTPLDMCQNQTHPH